MVHDEYVNYEAKLEEKEKNKDGKSDGKLKLSNTLKEKHQNVIMEKKMLLSAKILERMVTQNIFSDIAFDFKYWEDRSDDYKDFEGTLYPLWTFTIEEVKKFDVTSLCWSKKYQVKIKPISSIFNFILFVYLLNIFKDLFAVGYGSYDFYDQPEKGIICIFSLKNCTYPEYTLYSSSGVMSLDFHPAYPQLLVAGLQDGNVAVYNLLRYHIFMINCAAVQSVIIQG